MGKLVHILANLDDRYKLPIFLVGLFNLPILAMIFISSVTSYKISLKVVLDVAILVVCFKDIKKAYFKSKNFEGGLER